MNQYELYIECKACRDGSHAECTGRNNESDSIVQIRCTCQSCKKNSAKSTIKAKGIDISGQISDRNDQVLDRVEEPVSNTNQDVQPFFMPGALNQEND